VFDAGRFHDHGVLLEYELPMSSRRLDCIITGRNDMLRDNAVKQTIRPAWQRLLKTKN